MHAIKQTFKIVLNHKYSIFALLFIQTPIFEDNLKKNTKIEKNIIKRVQMNIIDKSSINHNNLGFLFVESLPTTSRSEGRLVGYYFLFFFFFYFILLFIYFFIFFISIFFKFSWVLIVDYIHVYTYSLFISIEIHNSISFTHCGLQINHHMPLLRRHRQGSVGL